MLHGSTKDHFLPPVRAYDVCGRKVAEFGTGVQPAVFTYDDANHMISLITWRMGRRIWKKVEQNGETPLHERYLYRKTPDGGKGGWTCAKHAPGGREAVGRLRVNYRYYNPRDGRWTRRDPAKGDYNLSVYVQNFPIKSSDYLGLMSVSTCDNLVSNILNNPGRYSARIRQLIDKLKKKRCGVPIIYCAECCDERLGGSFSPPPKEFNLSGSIKLCSNNSTNATEILEVLAHELIHALQYCEFDHENDDWYDCDVIICQEMQAYRESGECQRTDPGNVEACVKKGAYDSSEKHCLNKGLTKAELKNKIASMYKSCYGSYGNPFLP